MATAPRIFVPAAFLDFENLPIIPYVVLVLNSPISRGELYEKCAARAMAIIAADGGGNRIFDYVKGTGTPSLMNILRPETIIGDLDSLRPETERFFRERGTTIVKNNDLYSTDFTKSLHHIASQTDWWIKSFNQRTGRQANILKVLIFGGLGGRADQAFSQIHHLFAAQRDPAFAQLELYLATGDSIMFTLNQGFNLIDTPLQFLGENIGIIPIGKPASVTTRGFEWDVMDWQTSFGTQLSTSNYIRAPQCSVTTTENLLFTVELPSQDEVKDAPAPKPIRPGYEGSDDVLQPDENPAPSVWSYT